MTIKKSINYPTNTHSIRTAYILFILTGVFGGHHLYLGNQNKTILYFFTGGLNCLAIIWLHFFSMDVTNWLIKDDHWFFYAGLILVSPLLLTDLVSLARQTKEANEKLA